MSSECDVRFVSSAHIAGHELSKQFGKSFTSLFTYIKNKKGPRFYPWGTPQLIFLSGRCCTIYPAVLHSISQIGLKPL